MGAYKVRWQVQLEALVIGVDSEQEARERIEDCDPLEDGEYLVDSFEIVKVEKA